MSSQPTGRISLSTFTFYFGARFLPPFDQGRVNTPPEGCHVVAQEWPTRIYACADHSASNITMTYTLHALNSIPTILSTGVIPAKRVYYGSIKPLRSIHSSPNWCCNGWSQIIECCNRLLYSVEQWGRPYKLTELEALTKFT
jgi:hypothetical protein